MNTPLFHVTMMAIVATSLASMQVMAHTINFWSNMFRYPGYVPKKPS